MSGMFDQDSGGGGTWAYVNKGELIIYEKDPEDSSKKIKVAHRSVVGTITGWEFEAGEFEGKPKEDWLVKLRGATGDKVTVVIPVAIGYFGGAVKALANADLTKPVMIKPTLEVKDGKKYGGIFISQYDEAKDSWTAVKWAFTKDNPKGMPPPDKMEWEGEVKTSFKKQIQWLKDYMEKTMKPIVDGNKQHPLFDKGPTAFPEEPAKADPGEVIEDDLPF